MQNAALIVAAGRGTRLGGEIPKQYVKLHGSEILRRTLQLFLRHPAISYVQTVINPLDEALYAQCIEGFGTSKLLPPVPGGATRVESVRLGLDTLAAQNPNNVLIHDAARPFCTTEIIDDLIAALKTSPGAFPALPVVDALWRAVPDTPLQGENRQDLWRAQTPQAFRFYDILAAHNSNSPDCDDDVGIAVAAGLDIKIVPGSERNFKITTRADLERAERMDRQDMDVRTGNGFDVHRFAPGDHVVLNGVTIPFDKRLEGHSDADVGMHAITDAIFGALAEGDIGRWFPPSDPQWKGAASEVFLKKAVEVADQRGYRITSIDCTLICEKPKVGPHAEAMRNELARICGIDVSRISVKATTSEKLGFTGREEGIAAMATATLVSQ